MNWHINVQIYSTFITVPNIFCSYNYLYDKNLTTESTMNDVTQTWENKLLVCLLNIFVMFRKSESSFFVNMKSKF